MVNILQRTSAENPRHKPNILKLEAKFVNQIVIKYRNKCRVRPHYSKFYNLIINKEDFEIFLRKIVMHYVIIILIWRRESFPYISEKNR